MSYLKQIYKILFLFSLVLVSVVMFQYIGSSKLDLLLIGVTSAIIGLVIFIFYESAIRGNKRLFVLFIILIVMLFSLSLYKKLMIMRDRELISNLILVTKELKNNRFSLERLVIRDKHEKNNNKNDNNEKKHEDVKENQEVKSFNKNLTDYINFLKNLIAENIKILGDVQHKTISGNDKIRIKKKLLEYNDIKEEVKKRVENLKKENDKLKNKLKEEEEEAKNRNTNQDKEQAKDVIVEKNEKSKK